MAFAKIVQTDEEFNSDEELQVGVVNYLYGCGLPIQANLQAVENCTNGNPPPLAPLAPFATVLYNT